jgi:DNA repair protein RadC
MDLAGQIRSRVGYGRAVARLADHPTGDLPRERLWRLGVSALSDVELIALVLRSGCEGTNALELAARLLATHGDVATLAARDASELAAIPGVGRAKAASVLAGCELGARRAFAPAEHILGVGDLVAVARHELRHARREQVLVVVLGPGHRLLRCEHLTRGSTTRAPLPVREVLHAVLRHDGVAFAIAHNHPSGNPIPSEEDRRVTARLAVAARSVGLTLLDHVVIAADGWTRIPFE